MESSVDSDSSDVNSHFNIDPKSLNISIAEDERSEDVNPADSCVSAESEVSPKTKMKGKTMELTKCENIPLKNSENLCKTESDAEISSAIEETVEENVGSGPDENVIKCEERNGSEREQESQKEDRVSVVAEVESAVNGTNCVRSGINSNPNLNEAETMKELKVDVGETHDCDKLPPEDNLQFDDKLEKAVPLPEHTLNPESQSVPSEKPEGSMVNNGEANLNQNNNSRSLPLHCTTTFTVTQNGPLSPTSGMSNGLNCSDHSVSSSPGTSTSSLSSTPSQTAVPGPMSPGSGPASAGPQSQPQLHTPHTRVNTPPGNLPCPVHTVYSNQASSPTRFSPNGTARGESPHSGASGPGSPPSQQQHVVHVHINPGETFSVRFGDQMQHIQGPATVRMVSNNGPPLPMPMQVGPGHMVQQIVDERGILTHVILSPQIPGMPGNPMTVGYYGGPNGAQYYPPYAPPYPTPPQYSSHHHPHPGTGSPPHVHPGIHHAHIHPSPAPHTCNNHPSPHSTGQSPAPANHHVDERSLRQRDKMKAKYERRVQDGYYSSGPAPSRKTKSKPNKGVSQSTASSNRVSPTQNGDDLEEEHRELQQQLTSMPAPKITEVEARRALVLLEAPEFDQSVYDLITAADFCYELLISEKGRDGKYKPIYKGDATEITLKDLKPATEYFLKASTLLDEIRGNPTEPVNFQTQSSEPDPPQAPKLSSKNKTSLTVKWNSTSENGSKLQKYILEYDQGCGDGNFIEIYSGVSRQFRVSKLQASTRYAFRVAAVNVIGISGYSEVSTFYTSGSVPSAPDPPMLSEGFVNALTISWIKRPNDDDFTLHMEEECTRHGFIIVYDGPNLSHTVKTLRRNAEYRFKLSTRNEEGQGKLSDIVCYKTKPDKPSPPLKPQTKGKLHAHDFRVCWEPPKDNGGSEITSFSLEMDDGRGYDVVYDGLEKEFVCDNLIPGHCYRVRARCRSDGGISDYSESCSVTTQPVPPGQCQSPKLQGKPKASSLHLRWNYPENDGGSTVTEFTAQMSFPDNTCREVYRGRDLDCIVAGLSPGRPYLFQVRAHNKAGPGRWSESVEVVSGAGVPDGPKAPQITCKSPHSALITWEEPVNNGATIAEYKLEWMYKAEPEFMQLYLGSNLSYEVKGLTPASQYSFKIQAINSAGSGPFSSPITCVTPPSSPAAVVSIRCIPAATTIALTWKEPNCNGSEIIAYNIDIGEKSLVTVSGITEHVLEGLSPETTYKIRIQAVNEIGMGAFSSAIKVTTRALPPNPPRLECISTLPNSLKLRWGDGRNQDLVNYTLEMEKDDGSFVAIYVGPAHTHKVNKLAELTSFEFRIFASNDAGDGPYSDTFTFTTTKAPPPALKAPRASEVGLSHCVLEWQSLRPMGSDLIHYVLQIQALASKDVEYKEVYRGPNTSYRLSGLLPNAEFQMRVCAVRQSSSKTGDIQGAFSPGLVISTLSPEPVRSISAKLAEPKSLEPKKLTDQQWALIILSGFALFAVLVAFIAHQILSYTSHSSSRQ